MYVRVSVDKKGRITIPKEFREKLGIKEGDEVILTLRDNKVIIEKAKDPFKVLEELLGDLTFTRDLRKLSEEEALKEVKKRWS